MNIEEIYNIYLTFPLISTDTRNILEGSLFFALKGENFNGNSFAPEALIKGAQYAIVDEADVAVNEKYIVVKDVLKTLQDLAIYHRKKIKIPVIGITGTNGKTTSKELINSVLSVKYKTIATKGNLNNHIGVPLTILSISSSTEIAVVEMGANHLLEIAQLCCISQPDYGIITNIGKAHLEGFGGFEGVVKTKCELYDYIIEKKGKLFVNIDNELLDNLSKQNNRITYGKKNADCNGVFLESNPYVRMKWQADMDSEVVVNTNLVGEYNFENILLAICIGNYFEVDNKDILKAIASYVPTNNRSQVLQTKDNVLFLDAYNANPSSMQASLLNFSKTNYPNKTIIIGDMLELGADSEKEHLHIINLVAKLKFYKVFLVGKIFKKVNYLEYAFTFDNSQDAHDYLINEKQVGETILLKGSRGIKLEKIKDVL